MRLIEQWLYRWSRESCWLLTNLWSLHSASLKQPLFCLYIWVSSIKPSEETWLISTPSIQFFLFFFLSCWRRPGPIFICNQVNNKNLAKKKKAELDFTLNEPPFPGPFWSGSSMYFSGSNTQISYEFKTNVPRKRVALSLLLLKRFWQATFFVRSLDEQ